MRSSQVITGDCLEVMRGMPDRSVDMIFTDPPYGHKNNNDDLIARREAALGRGKSGEARPIANDGEEANGLVRALFAEAARILQRRGGGGGPDPQFARWSLWLDEHLSFKQMVVWDKGPMGMGWHYRRSYETVLVAQTPGKAAWYDESNRVENVIRPGDYGIRKIIPRAGQHPTEKPWQLAAHFIRLHTKPGDVVFDPFSGSGSTGEAAVRLGRRFIGVEIDEKFAEGARRRIGEVDAGQLFRADALAEAGVAP